MELPYELCHQIISYLPPRDLFSMCLVHPAHLETARQFLYREVSAPLSLAGIQRLLEISRDPVLAPLVRTFTYPTDTAVLISDIDGNPHHDPRPFRALPAGERVVSGVDGQGHIHTLNARDQLCYDAGTFEDEDDGTDIVLLHKFSAEELELVEKNNRKRDEQRAFVVSPAHKEMLSEALRGLPNLEALSLQLGTFKVDEGLRLLVRNRVRSDDGNAVPLNGGGHDTPLAAATAAATLGFASFVHWGLFDIVRYPDAPIKTLELDNGGFLPRCGYRYNTSVKNIQQEITTLRLRFSPSLEFTRHGYTGSEVRFLRTIPALLKAFTHLKRLSITFTNPDPTAKVILPPSHVLPCSFGISERPMRGEPGRYTAVHTLELEGMRITSAALLVLCSCYRATLKRLAMRRICLVGEWAGVMDELKRKERRRLQALETLEMQHIWEESAATGARRKHGPENLRGMVQYLLGAEDAELVLAH